MISLPDVDLFFVLALHVLTNMLEGELGCVKRIPFRYTFNSNRPTLRRAFAIRRFQTVSG
jgi:hypothetical protein